MRYLIIISILLVSCSPCRQVAKHPECFSPDSVIITNTIIQKDSIYYTKPDSMSISLLFECDSNNNVLMRELNDISSKGLQTKIVFKDNRLDISGYVDSIAVLNKLIETTKSKEVDRINPVNTVLKQDNEKLVRTNKVKGKVIWFESILLLIIGLIVYIRIKL